MSPEVITLLYTAGGLIVGWLARHFGIGAGSPAPAPGGSPAPAMPSTGRPLLDAILPFLLKELEARLAQHAGDVVKSVMPATTTKP